MRRNARKLEVIGQIEDFLSKRTSKNKAILEKFQKYLEIVPQLGIPWTEEALEKLERMPHFVRSAVKKRVEGEAKKHKQTVISLHFLEQASKEFVPERVAAMDAIPFSELAEKGQVDLTLAWDPEPLERVRRIPIPSVRRQVVSLVESYAKSESAKRITADLFTKARALKLAD
jgi:hypothetical protein